MDKVRRFNQLSEKQLITAGAANLVLAVAQFAIGLATNSLALSSYAVHDFIDFISISIAYVASKKSQENPSTQKTFGYSRASVLASLATSLLLSVVTLYFLYNAVQRLYQPKPVEALPVLFASLIVFGASSFVATKILRNKKDLNVKSIFLHVLDDALGSLAVIISSVVILLTGFTIIDPIMTFIIGAIILHGTFYVAKDSLDVLMESVPSSIDLEKIRSELASIKGVEQVHDLHVWSISPTFLVLSCHLSVQDIPVSQTQQIALDAKKLLLKKFRITHSTIEFECTACKVVDGQVVCD